MNTQNKIVRALGLLLVIGVLASCGGSSDGGAAEGPAAFRLTLTSDKSELTTNAGAGSGPGTPFTAQVSAEVRFPNGSLPADGTVVTFSTSNGAVANVSEVNGNNRGDSVQVAISGGLAQALVHARTQAGTANVTASAFDAAANRTASGSLAFDVIQGQVDPCQGKRLCLTANQTRIPTNPGFFPAAGTPYETTVVISFFDANGALVDPPGAGADEGFGVSVTPADIASLSIADDPDTDDVNERLIRFVNAPVGAAGGRGTIWVQSNDRPGSAFVSVTVQDDATGTSFSDTLEIEVVNGASDGLPGSITLFQPQQPLYVQQSGGSTAASLSAIVSDPAGLSIQDPIAGVNNVRVELQREGASAGETLRGVDANGGQVSGDSIEIPTAGGFASFSVNSGSEPRTVVVTVTTDGADNNVDNGITSPITADASVVISDGEPFAVEITTFTQNTLQINTESGDLRVDEDTGFPLAPNATYSFRISAKVTDRAGNPPAVPVALAAGVVDSPLISFAGSTAFAIGGGDGDPEESGSNFTAPLGEFTSAGGGVGPNDTLLLFGEESNGFEDHESARTVTQVIDGRRLLVDDPFNPNDTTGVSVNNGAVIPYLVGRARFGSTPGSIVTDSDGVASGFLTYPVSQLGRTAALYVQGTRNGADGFRTFADVELLGYPGLAPFSVSASPNAISANRDVNILVCVADGAGVPVSGVRVGFQFSLSAGTGTVDGQSNAGVVANATGSDGCTLAAASTSGVSEAGGDDDMLIFTVGSQFAEVAIIQPTGSVLQASPSAIVGDGGPRITLRYLDSSGTPIVGVPLTGSCEASQGAVGIRTGPGVTDENGETEAVLTVAGLDAECVGEEPGTGSCAFTAPGGSPETTVEISGRQGIGVSPQNPNCT